MKVTGLVRNVDLSKATLQQVFALKPQHKLPIPSSVPTHQLLKDLGFINQPSSGVIHWLPLGLRSLRKLESIIRKRMDEIGGAEVSLSSISSKKLWEKTGRWGNNELFKMNINDKNGDLDFCLTPTHEEEITELVNKANVNYKNLPLLLYQISRKYRFEKRPRGGLLRGREFLMKDAYSFDIDSKSALETYNLVRGAYFKIFTDLKIPFEIAQADSGDIGGNLSEEWHIVSSKGEDLIYKCSECNAVSNVEKTVSIPDDDTPSAKSAHVKYALSNDGETLIAAYYPSDRLFMPNFLKDHVEDINMETLEQDPEELIKEFSKNEEDLLFKKIIRVMDIRLDDSTDLPDFPLNIFQRNNFSMFTDVSIVEAIEGEICGICESGRLKGTNAIEVGHTFYLGDKYSRSLETNYVSQDNKLKLIEMGCYGIGVSRIIATIAEISRDDEGLIWPSVISPYDISIIESPKIDKSTVDEFIQNNIDSDLDIQLDQRPNANFGSKINQSRMLGIPIIVVIGKNYPTVELEIRGKRWNGLKSYEDLHNEYSTEWHWEITSDKGHEKHFVHKDHVSKVIKALLRDL